MSQKHELEMKNEDFDAAVLEATNPLVVQVDRLQSQLLDTERALRESETNSRVRAAALEATLKSLQDDSQRRSLQADARIVALELQLQTERQSTERLRTDLEVTICCSGNHRSLNLLRRQMTG